MTWLDRARAHVREVTRNIPEDATIAQRRKALRAAGPLFHGNTYWGRKQWGKAVREYLERHGLERKPRDPLSGKGADYGRLLDRMKSGDITFPFKEAQP